MYAPGQKPDVPVITPETMLNYDAFLFGILTRFGNYPASWKVFIDQLGGHRHTGALFGK